MSLSKIFSGLLLSGAFLLLFGKAFAEEVPWRNLGLDVPLIDAPFNTEHQPPVNPSMTQSLNYTKDVYRMAHWQMGQWVNPLQHGLPGFGSRLAFFAMDYALLELPLGQSWMHEEWHRAVMSHRGIDSHNGVYTHFGSSLIPVDRVTDEDLVRLKREHPEDLIRLDEAGMESEHELALQVNQDLFFERTKTFEDPLLWYLHISPIGYVNSCATSNSNKSTDKQNEDDGADVSARDFTGLDCNGWAYDIDRPNEDYAARGVHPSGVGINRYRKIDDLTDSERSFLNRQRVLSYINLLDPMLIHHQRFSAPFGYWNVSGRHHLTSFGYAIDANLFLDTLNTQALVIAHTYANGQRMFPGLEVRLFDMVLPGFPFLLSTKTMLWQQPQDFLFDTTEAKGGALGSIRLTWQGPWAMTPYGEAGCKSQGWVAGEVYQEQNCKVLLGFMSMGPN